jgi:hypothetical protein
LDHDHRAILLGFHFLQWTRTPTEQGIAWGYWNLSSWTHCRNHNCYSIAGCVLLCACTMLIGKGCVCCWVVVHLHICLSNCRISHCFVKMVIVMMILGDEYSTT